jgi:hypothetical protein
VQVICSECGQPFDDDQCCYVCVARDEAIQVTFYIAFPVAIFGISLGSLIALDSYPPLFSNLLVVYMVPAISLVVALALAFILQDQLTRYATLVRLLIVLVAATFVMPPAYYFMNGILDGNPAREIPAIVLGKYRGGYKRGGPYLVLSLPWNSERINVKTRVSDRTFSDAEPGDSVRLVVHPGAFSLPWHEEVTFR